MKLQLKGFLTQSSALISVSIDGQQVFLGQLFEDPLNEITFFEKEHPAQSHPEQPIKITVTVLQGQCGIGSALIWVDDFAPRVPGFYTPRNNRLHVPSFEMDHRSNICINGIRPAWPAHPVEPMPKGTLENPDWNGWVFTLTESDVMTFDIVFPHWPKSDQRLPFCQGDAETGNLQWYDADGNPIDGDPLGEDFWIARQNGVDQ